MHIVISVVWDRVSFFWKGIVWRGKRCLDLGEHSRKAQEVPYSYLGRNGSVVEYGFFRVRSGHCESE
jgi:hypothetical protein